MYQNIRACQQKGWCPSNEPSGLLKEVGRITYQMRGMAFLNNAFENSKKVKIINKFCIIKLPFAWKGSYSLNLLKPFATSSPYCATNYSTITVILLDLIGGLCGIWVQLPSKSCKVCLPGRSSIVVSNCPLPK